MRLRAVLEAASWTAVCLALAVAAGLAYLQTATPTTARTIQLVAFAPWAVPLSAVAMLAAFSLALLRHGTRRRLALALALVAALLTGITGSRQAGQFLGPRTAAAAGPAMTVMVQNLEYGDPLQLADRAIRSGADLLVITDAGADTVQPLRSTELTRVLPYSVGLRPWGPEGSVVFSRYPIEERKRISDGGDSRAVTVRTPELGELEVLALHPRPPYQNGWAADWERITRFVSASYATDGRLGERPLVVAGDLNATLDHAPLRQLQAWGFTDAVTQRRLGFQPTWPAPGAVRRFGVPVPPLVQIDHVLTSPALAVTDFVTYANPGSDHLGLVAEIQSMTG